MPTLLEMQKAMQASLLRGDAHAVAAMLAGHITADRLDIYRNTSIHTLTKTLRLCFPVTERLVGAEFFEGAAQIFIAEHPPRAAWLDQYGEGFSEFLRLFPPAKSIEYLGDVATLEWAVSCALHAEDVAPLDVAALGAVKPEDQNRIRFVPHPAVGLLRLRFPVDEIWRAVVAGDDDALGKVDLESGPIDLLIERRDGAEVEAERFDGAAWDFLSELCSGRPIEAALDGLEDFDCSAALAEHLALDRFCGFELAPSGATTSIDSPAA